MDFPRGFSGIILDTGELYQLIKNTPMSILILNAAGKGKHYGI